MSRIDEAMKRASTASGEDHLRLAAASEVPWQRAEAFKLEEYPNEKPGAVEEAGAVPSQPVRDAQPISNRRDRPVHVEPEGRDTLAVTGSPLLVAQYRRLATSLQKAQAERGLKTVMVTSALPGEGKTQTAVNLALTLGQASGRLVLLMDADLRKPAVHGVVGVGNERGLSEALGPDGEHVPLIRVSPLLTVLPAGRSDRDPMAALLSDRMRTLLEVCSSQFDWVVLDTPPVGLLSDVRLLARLTQAVVFVIGATPFPVVERAIAELGREHIIGTVLNDVKGPESPSAGPSPGSAAEERPRAR